MSKTGGNVPFPTIGNGTLPHLNVLTHFIIFTMHKHLFLFFFYICFLTGCSGSYNDNDYFNGEIYLIEENVPTETPTRHKIEMEGIYMGPVFAYDSLLFYYPMNHSAKYAYEIYNLKNDSLIGEFHRKGNGPNEAIAITTITKFFKENGELKTWLYTGPEKELFQWNITRSIEKKTTVIDSVFSLDWEADQHVSIYNQVYRLAKDTVLVLVPPTSTTLDGQTVSLPLIEKRQLPDDTRISSYVVYKKNPESNGQNIYSPHNRLSPGQFLSAFCSLKPDRTKLVQALTYLPQINIIDLHTGEIKGFRFADSYNFSIFRKHVEQVDRCFTNVVCDDQCIYALYNGINITNKEKAEDAHLIYVFDWNGKLVKKLDIGQNVDHLFLDHSNNRLYAREYHSDYTYYYTLE